MRRGVGFFGGVIRATKVCRRTYGTHRCFDTPISELGTVGAAVGMAAYGLRPCVEIQFADSCCPAYHQIISERHGCATGPTGRSPARSYRPHRRPAAASSAGRRTARAPRRWFHPCMRTRDGGAVQPGRRQGIADCGNRGPRPGNLSGAEAADNGPFDGHHDRPVTPWSNHELGEVPDGHYTVPLGTSAIRREGAALTILAYGTMVHVAMTAAAETGIDAEIIDLRTLLPLDLNSIQASVRKTGRCVIVHEATLTSGFGAELSALVQETCFYHLEGRPARRRLGHAVPACAGMGLFPRSGPRGPRAARDHGGVTWRST